MLAAMSCQGRQGGRGTHGRRRTAAASALLATLAIIAVGAPGAGAAVPSDFYGVVPNTGLSSADFSRMGQAHVGSLRFTIAWPEVQTSPNGPINFGSTDVLVFLAAQQHIHLIATLTNTPTFETGGCTTQDCQRHIHIGSASEKKAWQSFVKAVAQRYGKGGTFWQQFPQLPNNPISDYQIWNEVSNPDQKNSTNTYAKLLKLTDSTLHRADPRGKIVLSGMFATPPKKNGGIPAWVYLKQLYKHGAKSHFEEAALHPYPVKPKDVTHPIKKMRAAMKKAHDASTPLLISELGWGSSKKARRNRRPRRRLQRRHQEAEGLPEVVVQDPHVAPQELEARGRRLVQLGRPAERARRPLRLLLLCGALQGRGSDSEALPGRVQALRAQGALSRARARAVLAPVAAAALLIPTTATAAQTASWPRFGYDAAGRTVPRSAFRPPRFAA